MYAHHGNVTGDGVGQVAKQFGCRLRLSGCLATAALLISLPAWAQPAPKLTALSSEWIQRGTNIEVRLDGENLAPGTSFLFSGDPGLSASNKPPTSPASPTVTIETPGGGISRVEPVVAVDNKRVVARIAAAADAALGARELRVVTPNGVSNPLTINVGHLPEATESGSNNTLEQAQDISLPLTLNGAISAAAQTDYYKFTAKKGEELVFEMDAARRGSPLDSSLTLLNSAGKELARNEDGNGLDSLLFFTPEQDGEYILQIRDFRYSGGGNYTYRCYGGVLPYVQSIFPFGGQRGKQVEAALKGRNLQGTDKITLNIEAKAPLGRREIRASTPRGLSNLIPFDVSDFPDFNESETNDTVEAANSITLPVAINGRIGRAKDVDRFKFKVDKDQKVVCDVAAYRFGSPLDAVLMLTDPKGAVLQQNDDSAAADARIEFDAKKDTEYVIAVRDLTGRGGDPFGYRLMVRPPSASEASFQVRFTPDTPRVHRGGQTRVRCEVIRSGGFDAPVRLAWENLPSGVSGESLVMTTAPGSGLMLLTATKDATLGTTPIRLVGSATAGGRTITRAGDALAGDKPVKQSFITVLEATPFTLEPVTLTAAIEQNQSATFEVLVQRNEGFTGEVKVSAEGYSAGSEPITKSLEVREATLKSGEALARVRLKARLDAEIGTRTVVFRGETTVGGAPVVQYSRPVPVTVTEVPFVISSTLTRLSVTALPANSGSAASEAATAVKLQRRSGFAGEVNLTLEGLPNGVQSTLEKIPANGAESTLKLVAGEKAPPGTNTISILAAGTHNDRNFKHKSTITLTINAPDPMETLTIATNSTPSVVGPGK